MTEYTVDISAAARREFRNLPRNVQAQIRPVIRALATEPRPSGVVKMEGDGDLYRVRSGDYRIIYSIEDAQLLVLVVKIGNRRDVYR